MKTRESYLANPIPYMGNKYKLLKSIIPLFPEQCELFVDLFGGSGVVSMNYQGTKKTIYNEIDENIVGLAKIMKECNPEELDDYYKSQIKKYGLITKSVKIGKNGMTREKYEEYKDKFNNLRYDYNTSHPKSYKDLFLLSCYSVNHLIRFNRKGEFNASNGSDSYNEKVFQKIKAMNQAFKSVQIINNDALEFLLEISLLEIIEDKSLDTFIYCDPPYLNTTAVYNENRLRKGWTIDEDYKLFELLELANSLNIKWGLSNVFENRGIKNQHLIEWCNKNGWKVHHFSKNYNPFNREISNSDEVYICNY